MKVFALLALIVSIGLSLQAKKRVHHAHAHGEGQMTLAVDGKSLEIEMEIPADDIVGFEHRPKTKKQKRAVKTALGLLKNSTQIVLLPESAKCESSAVKVKSPFKGGHHHHHHHGHEKKEEKHSEFRINYKFKCAAPKALTSLTMNIFKSFPSLKEMKGQAVTMKGQFSQELTAKENVFMLSK